MTEQNRFKVQTLRSGEPCLPRINPVRKNLQSANPEEEKLMMSTVNKHVFMSGALLLTSATLLSAAESARIPTPEEFREQVKQYNQRSVTAHGQNVRQQKGVEQYNRAVTLHSKKNASAAELKEAAQLYQEAANAGIIQAEVNLALLYLEGKGLKKDVKKGQALLNAAAKKGEPQADLALARLYLSGKEVKQDEKKGEFHLNRAAKSGNQSAVKMLADYKEWKKKNAQAMKEYQEVLKRAQLNQAASQSVAKPQITPQIKPAVTLQELLHPAPTELRLPVLPGYAYLGANPLFVQKKLQEPMPVTDRSVQPAAAATAVPGEKAP